MDVPQVCSGKEIYLFGVEFADRNVSEWVVQKTPQFIIQALTPIRSICRYFKDLPRERLRFL